MKTKLLFTILFFSNFFLCFAQSSTIPTTRLVSEQCGNFGDWMFDPPYLNILVENERQLRFEPVEGAEDYQVLVSYSWSRNGPTFFLTATQNSGHFPGDGPHPLAPNGQHGINILNFPNHFIEHLQEHGALSLHVKVRAKVNGLWGVLGQGCRVVPYDPVKIRTVLRETRPAQDISVQSIEVKLFPNPSNGHEFGISIANLKENENNRNVILRDINGREVLRRNFTHNETDMVAKINGFSLSPGIYLVDVMINDDRKVLKLQVK